MEFNQSDKIAIFFDNGTSSPDNKMGLSYIRYHADKVLCIIDAKSDKPNLQAYYSKLPAIEIVNKLEPAIAKGVDTIIIADMPNGGRITQALKNQIDVMIKKGLSIVNGLHDSLNSLYTDLNPGQYIYDLRQVQKKFLCKSTNHIVKMKNKRVLLVGSDMVVGKMTAGLQLYHMALDMGVNANFLATGQVGIAISGKGIPLDAIPLDFTGGAVEKLVSDNYADLSFIEGQGSLNNPGSAATLPLLRGCMPTHLIFCHKTSLKGYLKNYSDITIPPIKDLIVLYEKVASACGTFPTPKTIGICVNTHNLDDQKAEEYLKDLTVETGIIAIDPIRMPDNCIEILKPLLNK